MIPEATPLGLGQSRPQAHVELRERRRVEGLGAVGRGLPVHGPVLARPAPPDLEPGRAVGAGESQPAGEHHRGETIPLAANNRELARNLCLKCLRIVRQCLH